jgi:hypothetical protein
MRLARPLKWMAVFTVAVVVCARLLAAYHQPDPTWLEAVGLSDGNDADEFLALVWYQSLVLAPSIVVPATGEPVRLVELPAVETPAVVAPPALVSRAPPASTSA